MFHDEKWKVKDFGGIEDFPVKPSAHTDPGLIEQAVVINSAAHMELALDFDDDDAEEAGNDDDNDDFLFT